MVRVDKLKWVARGGYAARGIVYLIVGYFAVLAALGAQGGRTTDSEGALRSLLDEPYGAALLAVIGMGLLGYAGWRVVQAVADADHHGTGAKGLSIRGGLLVSALTHTLLAVFAFTLAMTGDSGSSDRSTQDWTAALMAQPFGRWLVGGVGIAVIGAGIAQIVKGYSARFVRYLDVGNQRHEWIRPVSRFGLIAKGFVFLIIGGFFVIAALQADSSEARGLDGALQTLQGQPFGQILLGVVAFGLIAFGLYSLVEARYRRIST